MTDSLTMWFMLSTLRQVVSALLPEGLETEISPWELTTSLWPSPDKNSGRQSLGELPWLAVLCTYSRTSLPGGINTVLCSTESKFVLCSTGSSVFGTLLDPLSLPLAEFNPYLFVVINHHHECKSFLAFSEFCKPSSKLSNLRWFWGSVPHELVIGFRSEGCLVRFLQAL